jgi:hypothetical protein
LAIKSLSMVLAEAPVASLNEIASWWGVAAPSDSAMESRQRLERAMRDNVAARFVWERLGADERRVLYAVVGPSARNWCARDQLAERARLDPARTEAALARLLAARLLYADEARVRDGELVGQRATFYGYAIPRNMQAEIEDKAIVYIPTELATGIYTTGRELFAAGASRADKSLDDLLQPYRQGDLDQIGRRFGLTIQAYYSRNEVRAAMAENLSQAEAVRYALDRVDPPLRRLYDWLRARDGSAPLCEVRAFLRLGGPAGAPELAALLRALEEHALVFDTFTQSGAPGDGQGERILFIPRQVMANLRLADSRPRPRVGLVECAPPQAIVPADTAFLWDLAVLASVATHQEIELTRAGALPKRAAMRLLPLLAGARERRGEDEALAYVDQLLREAAELGIVRAPAATATAGRGRLLPGPKVDSWARHDQVMQARRIFRLWPSSRWWNDAAGAHYRDWLAYYIEQPIAREAVRQTLRQCRPGVWYTLASFRATVQGDDPFVLRPSQRNASEAGFRLASDLRAHWEGTDGEVIAGILCSTLRELGIVEVGYARESVPGPDQPANPDAFRVTTLGAEVMTSELSATEQPSPRPLVVQPNFQVLLLEPHMPALYWLVRHAALERAGRVSRFTLTREALERGLGDGPLGAASEDEVLAFLEVHSQKALPQNVVYTLRDWARAHQQHLRERMSALAPAPSRAVARAASNGRHTPASERAPQAMYRSDPSPAPQAMHGPDRSPALQGRDRLPALRDPAQRRKPGRVAAGVTMLEAGDAALAMELVTSPKLRAFRLRRVGQRKVAVPPDAHRGDLRRALERLGYASRLLSGFEELVAAAAALPTRRQPRQQGKGAPAFKGAL